MTDDTIELEDQNEEFDTIVDEANLDSDYDDTGSSDEEENDEEVTEEQLEAMSDEEFSEFIDTGKLPSTAKKTKEVNRAKPTEVEDSPQQVAEKPVEETQDKTPDIDYKAVYDSIFKPFKANGKEITPRSIEDVVSLMQMGANYTKKMQAIAPMKKTFESLNKAKINEEDLNFLIDIHNGDKGAIKKLLQKHNVDSMDLDIEDTNYVPHNNIVSDDDIAFSDVIRDLGEDLPKVQEIVSRKWDESSRKAILSNPDILRKLGEEVQLGRFDAVQAVLDEERTFGRYKGVSDLDAYIDIVTKYVNYEAMKQQQQQYQLQQQSYQQNTNEASRSTNVSNKSKAAPTRAKTPRQSKAFTASDIFNMSEEDFAKLSINNLV